MTGRIAIGVLLATAAFGVLPAARPAQAAPANPDGTALFRKNCAVCHQGSGQGVPGMYPRLQGRIPAIAAKPDGRRFLLAAVINGMTGPIKVDGQKISGFMPSFAQLPDPEIAAILNTLVPDGKQAISAKEVAVARKLKMSPAEVGRLSPDVAAP